MVLCESYVQPTAQGRSCVADAPAGAICVALGLLGRCSWMWLLTQRPELSC